MDGKRDRIFCLLLAAALFAGAARPALAQNPAEHGDDAGRARANPTTTAAAASGSPSPEHRADTDSFQSAASEPSTDGSAWRRLAAGDATTPDGAETSDSQPLPADPNDARPLGGAKDRPEPTGGAPSNWWLRTAVALAIVIGLIFLTRSGLRRLGGNVMPAPAGHMVEVLGRTSLGPKTSVLFLKLNHRILVVGQSGSGMDTLTEIDDPEEVAALLGQFDAAKPKSVSNTFRGLMDRLDRLYQGSESSPVGGRAGGGTSGGGLAGGEKPDAARMDGEMDRTREQLSGLLGRMRALRRDEGQRGGGR